MAISSQTAEYWPGDQFNLNADATLYALWQPSPPEGLEYAMTENGLEVIAYNGSEEEVSIPSEIEDETVWAIRSGVFGVLRTVYIPDSVMQIGEGSFVAGTVLAASPGSYVYEYAQEYGIEFMPVFPAGTLKLGKNVAVIETEAFGSGSFLFADLSRSSVDRIESKAFAGNERLKLICLPDCVSFIADDAIGSDVTIMTNLGSYAHTFAVEHGYFFIPIN